VSELGSGKDLPGPRPTLFFAPAQVKKRHADWGPEVFGAALVKAWAGFTAKANNPAAPWLVIEQHTGTAAVQSAYAAILAGQGDPRGAHMLSLSKV
jgi:hypothetical protein